MRLSPLAPLASLAALVVSLVSASAFAQAGSRLASPRGGGTEQPAPAQQPEVAQPSEAPISPPPPAGELSPGAAVTPGEEPVPAPGGPEAQAPQTGPSGETMRMIVIDAATFGIDPVVGRVASARMRSTGEELGYQVLTQEETVAAAQQLRMPYPPTPADLWRVAWVARTHRGVFARIWAHSGQYVIEITVASLDGAGPFFARGTAGADDLRETVDRLLRTALPPPGAWSAAGITGAGTPQPELGVQPPRERSGERIDELDEDEIERPTRRAPAEPEPELRRWQLTLQTEAAIGASQQVFYNHLVGLRVDLRITRDILIGIYAGYANLNARDGRTDNLLFMAQFENRIRISSDLDLTIPLRAAVGYLPFNGPVIRLAAGLNYAVDANWEIGIDILTPTFWILPDRTAVSLDIAIEGTYRF